MRDPCDTCDHPLDSEWCEICVFNEENWDVEKWGYRDEEQSKRDEHERAVDTLRRGGRSI